MLINSEFNENNTNNFNLRQLTELNKTYDNFTVSFYFYFDQQV